MIRIVAAAIRVGPMIISAPPPARHHTLMHAFWAHDNESCINPKDQGFLTSEGKFVGREEAKKIALAAEQVLPGQGHERHTELFSEDLF